ncbi:MAG TPA: hypothetical protein VME18_07345 [Acidobacteriaceae bacterium]|nr:hypothetical protein [Acidobacteriaceae bacterium]
MMIDSLGALAPVAAWKSSLPLGCRAQILGLALNSLYSVETSAAGQLTDRMSLTNLG